jgi:NAD(P)H dehydrogenase (quinone)
MKLAVTAASGQLGSAIVREAFVQLGRNSVIGIARHPEKTVHLDVEIRPGDYNNEEPFKQALEDIEVLLLVSGMDAPDKRIEQHRNVIRAARGAGVRKLVYTSIIGIAGRSAFDPIITSNRQDRIAAHGPLLGGIIAGIYEGIEKGAFDIESDFRKVMGRDHIPVFEYISWYKLNR